MDAEKATQGKVVGVIIPPPEIRAVVDKTAQFVAKNGKSFEQRILSSSEGKTAKFNFMKEFDPYHAYYEFKIRELEEAIAAGKDLSTVSSTKPPETPAPQAPPPPEAPKVQEKAIVASSARAALVNPIAKLAKIPPKLPPYNFEFTLAHPTGVSVADIDIIKLTAQYTAVNGRDFLAALATREQRNAQFDFLKPTHMLFSYFTSLVDAYAKLVHPSDDLKQRIQERSKLQHVLEYAVHRWNWKHNEEQRKRDEQSKEDADRIASQAIDWYEFTVVEVIEFGEQELLEIPGLATLDLNNGSAPPPPPPAPPKVSSLSTMAPPPPPPLPPKSFMIDIPNDDDDEKVKVVSNYKPRLAGNTPSASMMTIDPVTGKAVAMDQLEEHMRIQLLDPKWKEEQKRFQDKQKETGFAEGASIADSLKIFAQKRGDIFGQAISAGSDSAAAIAEQEAREQQRHSSQVQWDGHLSSMSSAQQLKASMPTMPEFSTPMSSIGPSFVPPPPLTVPPSMYSISVPPPPSLYTPSFGSNNPPPPVTPHPMSSSFGYSAPPPPPMAAPIAAPMAAPFVPQPPTTRPPLQQPSMIDEDQKNKKPRIEENLIPADAFAALHPNPIELLITIPLDQSASNWNLNGQTLAVQLSVTSTVKDLKEMLGTQYLGNMPANKMQLKTAIHGFLKDASLAALNIGPGTVIDVSSKSRGGKR